MHSLKFCMVLLIALLLIACEVRTKDSDVKSACRNQFEQANFDQAFETCLSEAEDGERDALFLLGSFYEKSGTEDHLNQACNLYEQAANKGSGYGMHALAYCYLLGKGREVNVQSGVSWLRQAAKQDFPLSLSTLGKAHYRGEYVDKDEKLSCSLHEKAANYAEPYSMAEYGSCLLAQGEHLGGLLWMYAALEFGEEREDTSKEELLSYIKDDGEQEFLNEVKILIEFSSKRRSVVLAENR
ncbi:tetratricopeptide repeat protein [Pleionea mediterranea]|uniref:Sel1 repeat-containing protein n=1 Tax=Pleionea mediterranea TaxID=523701 RepID=A0A316FTP4_9GAMM|nr:tetratricopeptide repeat protein [Pleionea mediterranea]PWK51733.1 Sel1 repeat-containing protein [Pleionea mediterranea]